MFQRWRTRGLSDKSQPKTLAVFLLSILSHLVWLHFGLLEYIFRYIALLMSVRTRCETLLSHWTSKNVTRSNLSHVQHLIRTRIMSPKVYYTYPPVQENMKNTAETKLLATPPEFLTVTPNALHFFWSPHWIGFCILSQLWKLFLLLQHLQDFSYSHSKQSLAVSNQPSCRHPQHETVWHDQRSLGFKATKPQKQSTCH